MMTKAQREGLQDLIRHLNGMFARWRKSRTNVNYNELEGAMEALSNYWAEVKSDQVNS